MEKIFVGDKNTEWYKKCRGYLDAKREQKETIKEFCDAHGIDDKDWKADSMSIFVREDEKYSEYKSQSKSSIYYDKDGSYYQIRKNSKLGKDFLKLGLKPLYRPLVGFELLAGIRLKYGQFIHSEHIYIRIETDNEVPCPEGFEEMKMSDYFALVEKIQEKSNDLYLENI